MSLKFVAFGQDDEYSLFAEDYPLVVTFDVPRTLAPGTPVAPDTFSETVKVVMQQPLARGLEEAIECIETVVPKIIQNGRFRPDEHAARSIVDKIILEPGMQLPNNVSVEAHLHTRRGAYFVPFWVRWVPAIPMAIIWLVGSWIIRRRLRRRGIVWRVLPDMEYA